MAKSNGIAQELVLEKLKSLPAGVRQEDKAAWIKVYGPHGDQGPRIYIAKQVRVRQIDLSDFGKGWVGTLPLKAPNGRVQAHLDMEDPLALWHLEELLKLLPSLPRVEKARVAPMGRTAKSPKNPPTASSRLQKGIVDNSHLPAKDNSEEAKAKRKALIEKVAREKGVAISPDANV